MPWLAAALAAATTTIATRRGPGLDADATVYLSAATNLAHGHGLRPFSGKPLTAYAPGLPAVLAVGNKAGLTVDGASRIVNAGSFAAVVVLAFLLLRRHVQSSPLVLGATVLVAVSVPLLAMAEMAKTEILFILIVLVFLYVLERVADSAHVTGWIAGAIGLVWVGFLVRYIGVTFLVVGGAVLVAGVRRRSRRATVVATGSFVALGAVVPLVWALRNHRADGTLLGPRTASTDTVPGSLAHLSTTVGSWILPHQVPSAVLGLVAVASAGVVLAAVAWLRRRGDAAERPAGPSLLPVLVFVPVYTGYLLAAQVSVAISPLGTRLLSPIYVPLVILVTVVLDRSRNLPAVRGQRWVGVAAGLLLVVLVADHGVALVGHARRSSAGRSYGTRAAQSSELAKASAGVFGSAPLYSTDAFHVWAVLRRQPILPAPVRGAYRSDVALDGTSTFVREVACRPVYLAWFTTSARFYTPPDELAKVLTVIPQSAVADGTLYRVERGPQTPPCQR